MVKLNLDEKACVLLQCLDKLSVKKRMDVLSIFDSFGDIFSKYDEYRDIIVKTSSQDFYDALYNAIISGRVEQELDKCD